MKKIILYAIVAFFTFSFTSCEKELDLWNSETLDYSGRFVFQLMSEDMQDVYMPYDGSEIQIYNTSNNVANEMWIDDISHFIPLKSKFSFTGTSDSFKSSSLEYDKLGDNIYAVNVVPTSAPTAAGQTTTINKFSATSTNYLNGAILEGKIIPNAATTPGGNKADSLYLKIVLHTGTATYTSYAVPVSLRKDPEKEEFAWKFQSSTVDPTRDETYVIGGYRYTGMPEDQF